jgi:hypothetical protein
MFFKKNFNKIQLTNIKFLFSIQNKLLNFNWKLMEDYKKNKDINMIESMNLVQDALNSLNKAQLISSKLKINDNVVNINEDSPKNKRN